MIVQFDDCFPAALEGLPKRVREKIVPILRQIYLRLKAANSVLELSRSFDVTTESPNKLKEIISDFADFNPKDKFYSILLIPDYYLYFSVFGEATPVCFMCGVGHFERDA